MAGPSARNAFAHHQLGDAFVPGGAIVAATDYTCIIPVAGASQFRIRARASGGGGTATLTAQYLRPAGTGDVPYDLNQPGTVDLADGVETWLDLAPVGESRVLLTLSGDGAIDMVVDYIDVMGLPNL